MTIAVLIGFGALIAIALDAAEAEVSDALSWKDKHVLSIRPIGLLTDTRSGFCLQSGHGHVSIVVRRKARTPHPATTGVRGTSTPGTNRGRECGQYHG